MINTLPMYPQMSWDTNLWAAPKQGHTATLSLPPFVTSQLHEAAPSLPSNRTDGNGDSSLVDGSDSSRNNNNAVDTSPFLPLKAPNSSLVDSKKSPVYSIGFSQPSFVDDQVRSFVPTQQPQAPPRRQHMMEDRVKNPCKVFIGGIGQGTVEATIHQHFSQYGTVVDCAIVTHRKSGKSRGFGFVTFAQESEAQAAVRTKHKLDDVLVECREALPRDEARVAAPHDSLYMPTKIFVGGIPDTIQFHNQEDDFKLFFQRFGEVIDVSLAYDKSNHRPRGFGFVVFATPEAANMAVGCHSFRGKTVEAKHAVPRDIPKAPKGRGNNRRGRFDEQETKGGPVWHQRFMPDTAEFPLQVPSMPPLNAKGPMTDVPPLLTGQRPFSPGRIDTIDQHNPYGVNQWGPPSTFPSVSAFDMMSQTMVQASITAGHATDNFSSGLSTSANIAIMSSCPALDRLLLGGRHDSGSSIFPLHTSPIFDTVPREDEMTPSGRPAVDHPSITGTGLLGGSQLAGLTDRTTLNPFLYSTATPSSPMQAMPLVSLTSPLLIPGQPCLGNFVSFDNLVAPNAQPSSPHNGQQQHQEKIGGMSGQRSWVPSTAGTSPMFAFINGPLSTAAPPFQLGSQNSLTSLNYFLSTVAVPPPPLHSDSSQISPRVTTTSTSTVVGTSEQPIALKGGLPFDDNDSTAASPSHFIASPSLELNGTRFDRPATVDTPKATMISTVQQSNGTPTSGYPQTLETAMQMQMPPTITGKQLPRFGQPFFVPSTLHYTQGTVPTPVTSPVFSPAARLMTSPPLATTGAPTSLLPIGMLHPPPCTPVSMSPKRPDSPTAVLVQPGIQAITSPPLLASQTTYDFNLPPSTSTGSNEMCHNYRG